MNPDKMGPDLATKLGIEYADELDADECRHALETIDQALEISRQQLEAAVLAHKRNEVRHAAVSVALITRLEALGQTIA